MSIEIRRLTAGDAAIAAEAIARLKTTDNARGTRRIEAPDVSNVFLAEPRNILIAAFLEGRAIGFTIGYVLDRVERTTPMVLLYEIEVASEHRRRGVARGMITKLREIAREVGAYKVWVLTDRENEAARGLYRATGGLEVDENLLIEYAAGASDL